MTSYYSSEGPAPRRSGRPRDSRGLGMGLLIVGILSLLGTVFQIVSTLVLVPAPAGAGVHAIDIAFWAVGIAAPVCAIYVGVVLRRT